MAKHVSPRNSSSSSNSLTTPTGRGNPPYNTTINNNHKTPAATGNSGDKTMKTTNNTMNIFSSKRAIYSVSRNEDGTLTIIREYIQNNGYWHKDGNPYKNAGLLIVQNGGVEALLSKCEVIEDIKQHVQSMNAERKASARWESEDNMKAKAAFEAAFSQEVTEATPENISTLLRYLNTVNWGVWNLPKMIVGYVCHQYDCDGKTATTIKLDTPVMFFEKPETMFVYGNPRGHLENYTKIG